MVEQKKCKVAKQKAKQMQYGRAKKCKAVEQKLNKKCKTAEQKNVLGWCVSSAGGGGGVLRLPELDLEKPDSKARQCVGWGRRHGPIIAFGESRSRALELGSWVEWAARARANLKKPRGQEEAGRG
jgi:hypothetical protein